MEFDMKTPIEMMMMDNLEWTPLGAPDEGRDDGIPYATHSGVLEIAGARLRCHRLSTGQAVFDADDMAHFWGFSSREEFEASIKGA